MKTSVYPAGTVITSDVDYGSGEEYTVTPLPSGAHVGGGLIHVLDNKGNRAFLMPSEVKSVRLPAVVDNTPLTTFDSTVGEFNIALAELAAKFDRHLVFDYTSKNGECKTRIVKVEEVKRLGAKGAYIFAHEGVDEYRTFKVASIDGEAELR